MKELIEILVAYKFSPAIKRLAYIAVVFLLVFHALVLISPFISLDQGQAFFSDKQIKYLQIASDSLANVTITLVIVILVVEGQDRLRDYILEQRQYTYVRIRDEILKWMSATKPIIFDDEDKQAKFIYGSKFKEGEVFQHLKVTGVASKILGAYQYPEHQIDNLKQYSEVVHFEITRYPSELLYGIHFEIDDYRISKKLCERLSELMNLERQSADFMIDINTPKKPGWIFLTRKIKLSGDIDKDIAKVMTHARHFVELVCHSYDVVYSKQMIDLYIQEIGRKNT